MAAAVEVSPDKEFEFPTHVVSRGFMANNDVMGLDRWSVYIATTESAVQRYAYNASIAGIIVGSLVFVGLIAFSVYVRAHIEGSNKLLLTMEKRVVDYFQRTFQKSLADTGKN